MDDTDSDGDGRMTLDEWLAGGGWAGPALGMTLEPLLWKWSYKYCSLLLGCKRLFE